MIRNNDQGVFIIMTDTILQIVRKYRLHALVFITAFSFMLTLFSQLGMNLDTDSYSYMYFISERDDLYQNIINIARPPVYPAITWLASLQGYLNFPVLLFVIQSIIISFGFLTLYTIVNKIIHSVLPAILILGWGLMQFSALYFVNRVNPEITVMTGVIIYIYLAVIFLKDARWTLPIVLFLTLLTFTKPAFLYLPLVLIFLLLFLFAHRYVTKKHIRKFLILSLFFYIIPVCLWSYGNRMFNKYFTFSNTMENIMIGKLSQYHMIDRGPEIINGFPIRQMIMNNYDPSPYIMFGNIQTEYQLAGDNRFQIRNAIYKYGNTVLRNNWADFVLNSIRLIPTVLYSLSGPVVSTPDCVNQFNGLSLHNTFLCSGREYIFITKAQYAIAGVSKILTMPLLMLSTFWFFLYLLLLRRNHNQIYIYTYLVVYLTVLYFVLITALGLYDNNYDRILVPVRLPLGLLFYMTLYNSYSEIIKFFRSVVT
jgi:hypothetical protein